MPQEDPRFEAANLAELEGRYDNGGMTKLLPAIALCLVATYARAWSEQGHHIVALIAFDLQDEATQQWLLDLLTHHPRFEQDFRVPPNATEADRYRIGRAAYWPDVARRQRRYNRPTWHYQLGATRVVGDPSKVSVHQTPGPLPADATLDTRDLYIAQAIDLCRKVMGDSEATKPDRAIALCWIGHLVGDAHQPCHAGSLYVEGLFPEGDRGANEIKTRQSGNLHALWDGLLGRRFDEGDVERRRESIVNGDGVKPFKRLLQRRVKDPPLKWLMESRKFGISEVYDPEVLRPIQAVVDGKAETLPQLDLSDAYLKQAGAMARMRALFAGYRLGEVWRSELARASSRQAAGIGN
ncbi:S1/P1 Nuclease [Posidoniimonas corsicana]|uniref:S1/P1 Nuclease n=1 Tax=Posidoniimonas corsicana TaxID=1938618 RepID=A0A5C5VBB9_9BACT|nr:S1/P1 nuclease [Posidoniimonas corsicana]TWT35581.1 S1/P1 Nuclease [Posidoniimonas corsicana]